MQAFNQTKFDQFVIENGIIGFFEKPIKLVSGRSSSWYVNWRNVVADVYLTDVLSDHVLGFCHKNKVKADCYYGTPDGATKLAILCQYKWASKQKDFGPRQYVLSMGRKTPKDHGVPQDRYFVGAPEGRVVVIEDVTTTGGSLIKTVEVLQGIGVKVVAALALTSRNSKTSSGKTVASVLKEKGVKYLPMSNALTLLPEVVKQHDVSDQIKESIRQEFKKYGEKNIKI